MCRQRAILTRWEGSFGNHFGVSMGGPAVICGSFYKLTCQTAIHVSTTRHFARLGDLFWTDFGVSMGARGLICGSFSKLTCHTSIQNHFGGFGGALQVLLAVFGWLHG